MKWFKHSSTARNNERIARLEDKAGLEGYGFYFKMLEIVAEGIDSTDRCEVTYGISRWGRQTNITTKKFLFLAQCCHDVGLIYAQRADDDIIVKIPNLLKHRDNHTKNLQATSKQEKEKEIDVDIEVKEEEEKKGEERAAPAASAHTDGLKKKIVETGKPKSSKTSATRLSTNWEPSANDISFCKSTRPDLSVSDVADEFRDYWIAVPGAKGKKEDWSATWRNWVRKQFVKTATTRQKQPAVRPEYGEYEPLDENFSNMQVITGERVS